MYLDYFGLAETPFSITPDPSFIYLSGRHRDALAHLLYGVGQGGAGGFVQLTGEVGTGKTTLCRALLEQVPEDTYVALVLNPLMGPVEMLEAICEELAIDIDGAEGSPKALVDRLNAFLLRVHGYGGRVVVVVDEAQNLSPASLEQIRLLTNLETRKDKLLQIILLGQPELRELLQRRDLRQLAQRVTARYHLTPLDREETARYVAHRLEVAGAHRNLFAPGGLKALYQRSGGVPRLINIIADRALAGAYAAEADRADSRLVHAAANEVQLGEPGVHRPAWPWLAAAAVVMILVGATAWWTSRPPAEVAPPGPAPVTGPTMTTATGNAPPEPPSVVVDEPVPSAVEASTPEPLPAPLAEVDQDWLEAASLRAWTAMAEAWGRPGDAALIEASCQGRDGLGYACIREQGNWSRIRQLGLPVVLQLAGEDGLQLMLAGLAGDLALIGGAADRPVRRIDLDPAWFGEYLVPWPQAANWPRQIKSGETGVAVDRVLAMARRADVPYDGPDGFGPEFERWLGDFQQRHGLESDGIVGPQTLLYLVRFSIVEPRLDTGFLDRD